VPLFGIEDGRLAPIRLLSGGVELYEREIEDLLWENIEDFLGEPLFRIRRQARLPSGGKPDILALDKTGRVVVVELKRGIDREQLSQALEYAGWARTTNLDELASFYTRGQEHFFGDWQAFTESSSPITVNRSPRVFLVCREVDGRTEQALGLLIESGVPVTVVPVSVYQDSSGRKFIDVEREESATYGPDQGAGRTRTEVTLGGRRVLISDLLDEGLLRPGEELIWERRNLGERHTAVVTPEGGVRLPDGRVFPSPSGAGTAVAGGASIDGWNAWRVERLDGALLKDLRMQLLERRGGSTADEGGQSSVSTP
jgi:hypothetical protein